MCWISFHDTMNCLLNYWLLKCKVAMVKEQLMYLYLVSLWNALLGLQHYLGIDLFQELTTGIYISFFLTCKWIAYYYPELKINVFFPHFLSGGSIWWWWWEDPETLFPVFKRRKTFCWEWGNWRVFTLQLFI